MANQYFTCVLDAWRDGRTLYGRMHYYRSGTYTYTDSSFPTPTMNLGGTVYYDEDFANRVRSGINVGDVYSTTFSRYVSGGGDRTVTWSAGSGLRSDFAGSWSSTVWFPEPYSDPSGLSVSVAERYKDGFKFNVSLSSYGVPSDASGRYIEAAVLGQSTYGGTYRYQIASNTKSASITVTNSNYRGGGLTINPNTMYYYGGYASNTQRNISTVSGSITTLADTPTLSVTRIGETSVTVSYSTPADGGKYAKNIQYSLDNGTTWTTGATVNTGAASSGTFEINDLHNGTTYTMKCRANTSAGNTAGSDVVFTTLESYKIYVPVAGKTKKVKKVYASVGGKTKEITKIYASVGGKTKRVF